MKKYLKYILLIVILVLGYKVGGKILDKLYLSRYDIIDYTGETRYTTVNKSIEKKFKKSDTAILVNTDYLQQAISIAPYAYSKNLPVFYIEKDRILPPTYDEMERLGVKKVILIGGVNYISNAVERSLDRYGYKYDRIIDSKGVNLSLNIAEKMNKDKKVSEIAVVSDDEMDLPNGISFIPYADVNNIPIFVTNNDEKDILKIEEFARKNNIKKTYLIGNDNYYNNNIEKILPNVERIAGEDRYDVNRNIMNRFYKDKSIKKVFISNGGELMHKRHIAVGQLINALSVTPLAADSKAPLMYIQESYFSSDEAKIIKEKGYKEINQVGFRIERRNFFNVERFKTLTTVLLVIIALVMAARVYRYKLR